MEYVIYTDGGARGNPGPAACGFVVFKEGLKPALVKKGVYLGTLTNNQAEYWGVLHALQWFCPHKQELGATSLEFRLDSELLVNQLRGTYKVKSPILRDLVMQVKRLERDARVPIIYNHVPREQNKEADRLVNQALDHMLGTGEI